MRRFEGRVALITGASRGIGLAVARTAGLRGRDGRHHRAQAGVARRGRRGAAGPGTRSGIAGKADDAGPPRRRCSRRSPSASAAWTTSSTTPASTPRTARRSRSRARSSARSSRSTWSRPSSGHGPPSPPGLQPLDRQHRLGRGPVGQPRHRVLRRLQGGAHQPHAAARGRARPRHPGQRGRPCRGQARGSRRRSTRGPRGAGSRRPTRSAASASPRTSPGPVAFLLSDDAAWITGHTLAIDGGASAVAGRLEARRRTRGTHGNLQRRRRHHAGRRRAVRHPGVREHLACSRSSRRPASPRARCTTTSSRRTTCSSRSTSGCSRCRRATSTRSSRRGGADRADAARRVRRRDRDLDRLPARGHGVLPQRAHALGAPPEGGHAPPSRSTTTSSRASSSAARRRASTGPTSRAPCWSPTSSATCTTCRTGTPPRVPRTRRSSPSS